MRYVVCVIRDSATDDYGVPYTFKTTGEAVRTFTDLVNRPDQNSQVFNHPEDFELFKIAEYESNTGEFTPEVPRSLGRGADVKERAGVQRELQ